MGHVEVGTLHTGEPRGSLCKVKGVSGQPATPYRDLLPMLSTFEFDALRADIKQNGVRDPVIVDEDGVVLDGHHRLKIDPNAPRRVVKGLSPAEKEAFVFRSNFVRRNMSADQKREAHQRMKDVAAKLRAEDPKKWTQAKVAVALGVDRSTVTKWMDTTNVKIHKGCTPDARVKVPRQAWPEILDAAESGHSQAQLASDYGVSQQRVSKIVDAERKRRDAAEERSTRAAALKSKEVPGFVHGDFREVADSIDDDTVDLIFTDPPYDRKSLPLFGDLGQIAAKKLAPGGSLITYFGQHQHVGTLQLLTPHLRFWWQLAVVHSGRSTRMREYGVIVKWKPLLWFVRDTRGDKETFVDDLVQSEAPEKDSHPWQQSVVEAEYYIDRLVPAGGFVWDPFCGGGTTAVACKKLGRRFITCDVDDEALAIAKGRFGEGS